ncbi:hypothetical protein [Sporomusa malonica]|uniref:Uncharacterized protein n=1 Tax=Sporomusa malonica TaxID=112901 RepID=A0A1W2AVL3_9FIRM|nr:hypothetical protein [Sporomusa malonica]SMC64238.1 hypothetical protein SAMN04488500_106124 [Sporomusa malonica]
MKIKKCLIIEGRLINYDNDIWIGTKEGICTPGYFIDDAAEEIGLKGDKFVRLTLEEIDEENSRSGVIKNYSSK